ncbi:MAG: hypothetical protein FJW37_04970 [Acidobacteria bacterium]|nr:hypothetical protein [Acidobacteriota bacterium]
MLLAVSGYAYWKVRELERQKAAIDGRIVDLEAALAKGGHPPAELSQILERLDEAQAEASALARNPLFRLGGGQQPEDFVREEIRRLLAEFGDQVYSIPPEFVEQVNGQVARYQGADRAHIERALGQRRGQLEAVRRLLEQEKLPPDLAYITLVESTFDPAGESAAGAAGVWQFTAATARAYGLRVTPQIDERLDLNKSTRVACRYLRELILDFGAGTSVMLALAAYNLGPAKVKQAVRKVEDPIRQRNFWHLYRVRALPPETRQFVPKVFAVILISRHPERFGFTGPKGRA